MNKMHIKPQLNISKNSLNQLHCNSHILILSFPLTVPPNYAHDVLSVRSGQAAFQYACMLVFIQAELCASQESLMLVSKTFMTFVHTQRHQDQLLFLISLGERASLLSRTSKQLTYSLKLNPLTHLENWACAVWACFLCAFLLISVLFPLPVFSHLRSEKRVLPFKFAEQDKI